jgi:hypothetical protein
MVGIAGVVLPLPRWTTERAMATETRRPVAEGATVQPAPPTVPPATAPTVPPSTTDPAEASSPVTTVPGDPAPTAAPGATDPSGPPPVPTTDATRPDTTATVPRPPPSAAAEGRVSVAEDTRDFNLIGVTLPEPPTEPVMVRTAAADGVWSEWHELEFEPEATLPAVPGAPVPDEPDEESPGAHSDPLWVGDARRYELNLTPDAAEQADVHLVYETSRHVAVAETTPAGADPADPAIIPRSSWGARAPTATPSIASRLQLGIVHHTAGTNNYSAADVPALLRGVQAYHMDANGWNDIGYNFAVDRFGRIWEARAGGVRNAVIGGHARGFNTGSTGVTVLGDFETAGTNAAINQALSTVLVWKFAVHDVDPRTPVAYRAGTGSPRYPPGSVVTLNRIVGHRDVGLTACPGRNLYPYLGQIRDAVAGTWPQLTPPGIALAGNFAGDASDDLFLRQPGVMSDLLLTASDGRFSPRKGFTINGDYRPLVGDFDGNGFDDLFWYAPGTGADGVWYSRGDGTFARVVTASVDGSYRPVTGDFDDDGDDDVLWYAPGTRSEYLWLASGASFRSLRTTSVKGDYRPAVGDFDGDGDDDILWHGPRSARDGLWSSSGGTFRSRATTQISGSYLPAPGDYDGDGDDDIVFYGPGAALDHIWFSEALAFTSRRAAAVSGSYRYVRAADLNHDGRDEVVWYASPGGDFVWWHGTGVLDRSSPTNVPLR